jgi:hypothetical protein
MIREIRFAPDSALEKDGFEGERIIGTIGSRTNPFAGMLTSPQMMIAIK